MDAEEKKLFAEVNNLIVELETRAIEGKVDPNAILIACTSLGVRSMMAFGMDDEEIVNALCDVIKAERERHKQYLKGKENGNDLQSMF